MRRAQCTNPEDWFLKLNDCNFSESDTNPRLCAKTDCWSGVWYSTVFILVYRPNIYFEYIYHMIYIFWKYILIWYIYFSNIYIIWYIYLAKKFRAPSAREIYISFHIYIWFSTPKNFPRLRRAEYIYHFIYIFFKYIYHMIYISRRGLRPRENIYLNIYISYDIILLKINTVVNIQSMKFGVLYGLYATSTWFGGSIGIFYIADLRLVSRNLSGFYGTC